MTSALVVLVIIAVVLAGAGCWLVLRHRTHLRRAAARDAELSPAVSTSAPAVVKTHGLTVAERAERLRRRAAGAGRIDPEPTR